jgi:exosortase A-associated hydrolase 1
MREIPLLFDVDGATLFGVASVPAEPAQIGVVIVVGGPQYRVGSHRQFVLLARALADAGIATLRFDCRGMGDSEGVAAGFEAIGPDIQGAIDAFMGVVPEVRSIVLWGLCDGATAAAFYAADDPRIAGLALYNPWVRTVAGESRVLLRNYYSVRLLAPDFWRKALAGRLQFRASLIEFVRRIGQTVRRDPASPQKDAMHALPDRLARAVARFKRPMLVGLSGNDFVAAEFKSSCVSNEQLGSCFRQGHVTRADFAQADHTFSNGTWRREVEATSIAWILALTASSRQESKS